jgi:hypothetical protein
LKSTSWTKTQNSKQITKKQKHKLWYFVALCLWDFRGKAAVVDNFFRDLWYNQKNKINPHSTPKCNTHGLKIVLEKPLWEFSN